MNEMKVYHPSMEVRRDVDIVLLCTYSSSTL